MDAISLWVSKCIIISVSTQYAEIVSSKPCAMYDNKCSFYFYFYYFIHISSRYNKFMVLYSTYYLQLYLLNTSIQANTVEKL